MGKSNEEITTAPNVGEMLKNHIRKNRLHRGVLARIMGKSYNTVYAYQRSQSMSTNVLWKLSTALKHNFFMDLAAQLPPEFSTYAPDPTQPHLQRIAALEEEIKMLNAKVETLKEVMQK